MVGKRATTGARHRLGEPLSADLADFCAINYGVDEIKVIRKAVAEHIERQLAANEGMRDQFEELRRKRLREARNGTLRSVE